MAENKISFILYCDLLQTVEHLTDEQAGRLFKHVLLYVNDEDPQTSDPITNISFQPIKQQLKRDLKKWEQELKQRRKAGKKGGIKSGQSRRSEAKRRSASKNEANEADTVSVFVTDPVTVRENTAPLPEFRIEECLTVAMSDDRWVKANKASVKDLQEFNKLLERRGRYKKNPADYKEHFHNWKAGGKKENFLDKNEPVQNLNGHLKKI